MPKVRRQNLPPALLQHLLDRIQQRNIPAMIVCGEGELVKTFLVEGQIPEGEEVL